MIYSGRKESVTGDCGNGRLSAGHDSGIRSKRISKKKDRMTDPSFLIFFLFLSCGSHLMLSRNPVRFYPGELLMAGCPVFSS